MLIGLSPSDGVSSAVDISIFVDRSSESLRSTMFEIDSSSLFEGHVSCDGELRQFSSTTWSLVSANIERNVNYHMDNIFEVFLTFLFTKINSFRFLGSY